MMEETRAKVLVVDDEQSVRDVLCETLVEAGEEVIPAADGQEALDLLSTSDVGVMLLDVRMPGLSGRDVLSEVQVRLPTTCVIMVSAIADVSTVVAAMKQGACDYVAKPFDLDDVIMAVERAFERRTLILRDRQYKRELEERLREQEARLHEQLAQLVEGLAREHELVLTVENRRQSKLDRKAASARPPELQPRADLDERFAKALRAARRSGA